MNEEISRITAEETDAYRKAQDDAKKELDKLEKAKQEKTSKLQSHQQYVTSVSDAIPLLIIAFLFSDVERLTQNLQKRTDEIEQKTKEAEDLKEDLSNAVEAVKEAKKKQEADRVCRIRSFAGRDIILLI